MQNIPKTRRGMLRGNAETIASSCGRIRLKIPFLRILKTSTNPSSFKPLELTIFVSFNCQNPTSSYEVFNPMLPSVTKLHSSKVQETAKFFKLGLLDLFCIFL